MADQCDLLRADRVDHCHHRSRSDAFSQCYAIVEADGGKFVLPQVEVNFDRMYDCDPENVIELKDAGAAAGLH